MQHVLLLFGFLCFFGVLMLVFIPRSDDKPVKEAKQK